MTTCKAKCEKIKAKRKAKQEATKKGNEPSAAEQRRQRQTVAPRA